MQLEKINLSNAEIGCTADQVIQSIFPLIRDGLVIQNGKAEITAVNPAAERLLGLAAADLTGQLLTAIARAGKLIHEDGSEFSREELSALDTSRTGTPLRGVVLGIYRPNGTQVWLALDSQPLIAQGAASPYAVATILRDISGHKRMEQAVAERERAFRSLAEYSPDFIVRYDRDGRHLYLNDRLLSLPGLASAEQVIGKRPAEAWPDGRFAELEQAAERAVELGTQVDIEVVEPTVVGRARYHQIFIVPERDESGTIVGTIAFGREITAIREAERQLKHFITNLPGMVYTYRLSPDGHASFPFISPAVEKFYGLKPEDVRDDFAPLHNFWHPDDRPHIEAAAAEAARTMQPFRIEARVCRPGQPERWLEARALPEREADGGLLWYGLLLDITGRKQSEALMVQREQEFRVLAENSPDVVVRYDCELRRIYINPAWEKANGIPIAEALGKRPSDVAGIVSGAAREFEDKLRKVLESGEPCEIEFGGKSRSGAMHYFAMRMAPEYGRDGKVTSLMTVANNITERKQAEQERQARARALECMERVNKAIQGTTDLERMMGNVLDVVLADFDCDRAFLLSPGTPSERELQVPMERTRPEYPGALAAGINAIPIDQEAEEVMRFLLDASEPVIFAPGTGTPPPVNWSAQFGFKSQMLMALHPKLGKPWIFGIHQCSRVKVWDEDDSELFQKIGQRLADALTSLLMYRNLCASEEAFRSLAENMPFVLVRYDREGRRTYINPSAERHFGITGEQMIGKTLPETNPLNITTVDAYQRALKHTLATGERSEFEMQVTVDTGERRTGNTVIVAERAADGQICGAITIGRDISQLKQAEQQLRELAAHIQTVREEELARLAREIHDDLGSTLAALNLRLSHLLDFELSEEMRKTPLFARLELMSPLLDNAIAATRRIITGMRPDVLENLGLLAALKWQAEQFNQHTGIGCRIVCTNEHDCADCKKCEYPLDSKQSINLFRIFQEALTNVARHSGASRVEVEYSPGNNELLLSISDNGCGLPDGHTIPATSFGMRGMRERVGQLGGEIVFDTPPGGGLRVTVQLHLPATGKARAR